MTREIERLLREIEQEARDTQTLDVSRLAKTYGFELKSFVKDARGCFFTVKGLFGSRRVPLRGFWNDYYDVEPEDLQEFLEGLLELIQGDSLAECDAPSFVGGHRADISRRRYEGRHDREPLTEWTWDDEEEAHARAQESYDDYWENGGVPSERQDELDSYYADNNYPDELYSREADEEEYWREKEARDWKWEDDPDYAAERREEERYLTEDVTGRSALSILRQMLNRQGEEPESKFIVLPRGAAVIKALYSHDPVDVMSVALDSDSGDIHVIDDDDNEWKLEEEFGEEAWKTVFRAVEKEMDEKAAKDSDGTDGLYEDSRMDYSSRPGGFSYHGDYPDEPYYDSDDSGFEPNWVEDTGSDYQDLKRLFELHPEVGVIPKVFYDRNDSSRLKAEDEGVALYNVAVFEIKPGTTEQSLEEFFSEPEIQDWLTEFNGIDSGKLYFKVLDKDPDDYYGDNTLLVSWEDFGGEIPNSTCVDVVASDENLDESIRKINKRLLAEGYSLKKPKGIKMNYTDLASPLLL